MHQFCVGKPWLEGGTMKFRGVFPGDADGIVGSTQLSWRAWCNRGDLNCVNSALRGIWRSNK